MIDVTVSQPVIDCSVEDDQVVAVVFGADMLVPYIQAARDAATAAGASAATASASAQKLRPWKGKLSFGLIDAAKRYWLYVTPSEFRHPAIDAMRAALASILPFTTGYRNRFGRMSLTLTDANKRIFFKVTRSEVRHIVLDAMLAVTTPLTALAAGYRARFGRPSLTLADSAKRIWFRVTPSDIRHAVLDAMRAVTIPLADFGPAFRSRFGRPAWTLTDSGKRIWLKITPTDIQHVAFNAVRTITTALSALATGYRARFGRVSLTLADASKRVWFKVTPSEIIHKAFLSLVARVTAIEGNYGYRYYSWRPTGIPTLTCCAGPTPDAMTTSVAVMYDKQMTVLEGPPFPSGKYPLREPNVLWLAQQKLYLMIYDVLDPTDFVHYGSTFFAVLTSPDGLSWTWLANVSPQMANVTQVWAPHAFVDADGTIYAVVPLGFNNEADATTGGPRLEMYLFRAEPELTAWTNLGKMTGTRIPSNCIDGWMIKIHGRYVLFFKNETSKTIHVAWSTNPQTGFDNGYATGWGANREGPQPFRLPNGKLRVYFDDYSDATFSGGVSPFHICYRDSADPLTLNSWGAQVTLANPLTPNLRHGCMVKVAS